MTFAVKHADTGPIFCNWVCRSGIRWARSAGTLATQAVLNLAKHALEHENRAAGRHFSVYPSALITGKNKKSFGLQKRSVAHFVDQSKDSFLL